MYKLYSCHTLSNTHGVKMQLDKDKILGEAKQFFGSKRYSKESISLSQRCVEVSQQWLDTYKDNYGAIYKKDAQTLKKELKKYIRPRIDYPKFIPSFVWWWIAQTVINWIIERIIEYLIEHQDRG